MNAKPKPELSPELLLAAYAEGYFPMGGHDGIHWYCPDPRGIIDLAAYGPSRSLRQIIKKSQFEISFNGNFVEVIHGCSVREETWISNEIIEAYTGLHKLGYAHSVETWEKGILVGGLYGVALGGAFFGESMFSKRTNASKIALHYLIDRLRNRGFILLDTQFLNPHLELLGGIEISREEYLAILRKAILLSCIFH